MLDGGHFVATLARLGYPRAPALKGEDFDWLFDDPKHQQFLRFFGGTLNRGNVLGPDEVAAFHALREVGKPLLGETDLAEVLKTCRSVPVALTLDEVDPAELEAELEELRKEKKLKIQRLRKLQVLTTSRNDVALRLASQQEDASKQLKNTISELGAENAETNARLQTLKDEVSCVASFLRVETSSPSQTLGPPVLVSQIPLEPYLQQVEASTKTLSQFMQKQFFHVLELQTLELSGPREDEEQVIAARREEMGQVQWAHVVAQHQLLEARAEEQASRVGLQWVKEKLQNKAKTSVSVPAEEQFQREYQLLCSELEGLRADHMPAILRGSARLLNLPVVQADMALQLARQEYYVSRQDQVLSHLLQQKAFFDLVLMGHQLEQRTEHQLHTQLADLKRQLQKARAELDCRLSTFSQPELALSTRPGNIIGVRDSAFSRLYQALECGRAVDCEHPLRTYQGLERVAQGLQEDLRSGTEALAAAAQEQNYSAALLEADCEALRQVAYCGMQQPLLTPQVRASAAWELCPNTQELKLRLEELEGQLDSLNKTMKDLLTDIQGKKVQLEHSPVLRHERDLYVFFHLNPKLLKKAVEGLEAKACGLGARP